MPSVTYYHDQARCANGMTYAANARRGLFCAGNHWPLGTRLELTSRGGRRVVVTVADRLGHGSDCDLCEPAARALMGSRYRVIGRVRARIHVLRLGRRGHRK